MNSYTTLVLWDKASEEFLEDLDIYDLDGVNIKPNVSLCLDEKDWNDKVVNGQLKGYDKIFVLAELAWSKKYVSQFYGLDLFREIMFKNRLADSDLSIRICSFFELIDLYNFNNETHKIILMKFPFVRLQSLFLTPKGSINGGKVIREKYDINSYLCLDKYGFIDILIHDLMHSYCEGNKGDQEFVKFLRNVQNLRTHFPQPLINKIDEMAKKHYENIFTVDGFKQDKEDIEKKLSELKKQSANSEQGLEKNVNLNGRKILLVEDNESSRVKLGTWFSDYGAFIDLVSNGEDAIFKLENDKQKIYDALITDLHLPDKNGFEGDVIQGIDLIRRCRQDYQYLALRVITSMPKGSVDKFIGGKDVIYKTPETIRPTLAEEIKIIKDLALEIKMLRNNLVVCGPKNGRPKVYYVDGGRYQKWTSAGEVDYNEIKDLALQFHTQKLSPKIVHGIVSDRKGEAYKKQWENSVDYFKKILFIRLIVLISVSKEYLSKKDTKANTIPFFGTFDYKAFREHPNFEKRLPEPKGLLSDLLGFGTETSLYDEKRSDFITLKFSLNENREPDVNDLFEEEFNFIENLLSLSSDERKDKWKF